MINGSFKFVFKFLGIYLFSQLLYSVYLWSFFPEIDFFSKITAEILRIFFDSSETRNLVGEAKIKFFVNGVPVFNIKEGCNGISVVIALLSFLFAFHSRIKNYFLFVVVSVLTILFSNILRLVVLVNIKLNFPNFFTIFHEYFFPVILYAVAFFIMVLWVYLSKKALKN